MAKTTTTESGTDVSEFILEFADTEQKHHDSLELIRLMKETTGLEPYMWKSNIIGFGRYHYKYASGHEGEAPLVGFSPRKAAISLYVFTGDPTHEQLLEGLGKFKIGKACIYIKKLADIDLEHLKILISTTINYLRTKYPETV